MPFSSSNAIADYAPTQSPLTSTLNEDFLYGSHPLIQINGSGGSQGAIASEPSAPGIWQFSTGTGAGVGNSGLRTEFGIPAQQSWAALYGRFRLPILPTSSDRYQFWLGLTNGSDGGFTNGVFYFMDEGSGNRLSTLSRNPTQDNAYSGQTPVLTANTWYSPEIIIDRAGLYTFRIRELNFSRTSSLNTPVAGFSLGFFTWINKTGSGTANRTLHLDKMTLNLDPR